MNYHKRYRAMLKALNIGNAKVAEVTGNTVDSIKSVTQPNKPFPRNLKFAIWVFERMSKNP